MLPGKEKSSSMQQEGSVQVSSVQSLSCVQLFATPWTAACWASLSITNSQSLCPLRVHSQTHVHWVSDAIQPSHPLSSPSPHTYNFPQDQGLFKWVSSLHQVAKVLEFHLQHQSFQWIFRTYFLSDGLVGSPCSPRDPWESSPTPQFKSINSSAFSFLNSPTLTSMHDYWKNTALTRQIFVGKVMSLLFNMLSRLVITFLPRSKCL